MTVLEEDGQETQDRDGERREALRLGRHVRVRNATEASVGEWKEREEREGGRECQ